MKLYEANGENYKQSDLVESLGIDKSNASRNISKLESKGLVEVFHFNKRDKGLRLTKISEEYKNDIFQSLRKISNKMTIGILNDDVQIAYNVIEEMKENLKR